MSDRPISVQLATLQGLQTLAYLFDQYRVFYGKSSDLEGARAFLEQRLTQQDSVIFLALIDGRGVGFTQLYPSFSSVSMRPIWILNDLFVESNFRRCGVAQALIEAAKTHGQTTQAVRLTLSTQISNLAAKTLYESAGFIKDEEFEAYVLPLS